MAICRIGRDRWLVNWPADIASFQARFIEMLSLPPLITRDQIKLLKHDNVVSEGALTLAELGIAPSAVETIIPTYLDRFRHHGRFAVTRGA